MKEAARELLRVKQEVFMPSVHRPGEAQVDFGYALAKVSKLSPGAIAAFATRILTTVLMRGRMMAQ